MNKAIPSLMLVSALVLLSACQSGVPDGAPTDLPSQINRLATQTLAAQLLPTTTATPEAIIPTPSQAPALLPSDTPVLQQAGPFVQVSNDEARIAGTVLKLATGGDGSLWLLSQGGFSQFKDGAWTGYLVDFPAEVAGMDAQGNFWVVSSDGAQISSWDGQAWSHYGTAQGWTVAENAWGRYVLSDLLTDAEGRLWLATQDDVRSFEAGAWRVYTQPEMDLPAPETADAIVSIELAYDPQTARLWAGSCHWAGPGPIGGGGATYFDQGAWTGADPQATPGCVSVIVPAADGGVWIGVGEQLWRTTDGDSWSSLAPPAAPRDSRYGFYTNLTLASDGSLWPELALCGGAGCFAGEALFTVRAGTWTQVGAIEEAVGRQVFFDGAGNTWLLSGGVMHQVIEGVPVPSAGLLVLAAAVDDAGRLWMVAQGDGPPSMWSTR